MIAYASRTGTRRNLDALRGAGWRLLVSAAGCLRSEGFPYALDNGAWSAFTQGQPFDERAFFVALRKMGAGVTELVIGAIVGHAGSTTRDTYIDPASLWSAMVEAVGKIPPVGRGSINPDERRRAAGVGE